MHTAAGRRDCDKSLLVVMAGDKRASRRVVIGDDYVEAKTRPLGAFVSLFQGGDIEAALAGVDHRVRAALLGHEGDKLVMVGHAAVGTEQAPSLPLAATAAAAEIAAPLDASHFGKCRPGTADRTIPFHPTYGFR